MATCTNAPTETTTRITNEGGGDMDLVYVEWVDSYTGSQTWQFLEDCKAELLECRSVGWIVRDEEEVLFLISNITSDTSENVPLQGCGGISIPKRAISRIVHLKTD